ncbi:hypothetical protein ACPPVS_03965 [Cellulomonas sp. McL0617]|uniref:hypothetical protein n=1 Tax=Cellulomonas sp. McL0617 TaxID=3415675 RepID=UPI003CFA7E91
MRGGHVFVDESKAKDFLLVAAVMLPNGVDAARRSMRTLQLQGQSELHMVRESDGRRRTILATITLLEPQVTIYRAPRDGRTELSRRETCLRTLVADCAAAGHDHLSLDRDASMVSRDNQQIIEAARKAGIGGTLRYQHETAASEPLLAIPDAVAWAWAKGGAWRALCGGITLVVRDV